MPRARKKSKQKIDSAVEASKDHARAAVVWSFFFVSKE
jgi:hypothetical protein